MFHYGIMLLYYKVLYIFKPANISLSEVSINMDDTVDDKTNC